MPLSRAQVTQEGLKLNGTHQLLMYTDDVNRQAIEDIKTPGTAQLALNFKSGVTLYFLGQGNSESCSTMDLVATF